MDFNVKLAIQGVLGLGAIASLFTNGIAFKGDDFESERAARQENWQKEQALEQSETIRQKEQAIANARYKDGCELIVGNGKKPGTFTFPTIHQDLEVIDRYTKKPMAKNKVICDGYGTSALMGDDGKPDPKTFASTGDRNLIQQRMDRYRGGKYAQPGVSFYAQPVVK